MAFPQNDKVNRVKILFRLRRIFLLCRYTNKFCICTRFVRIFGFALDTLPRQSQNKFCFAFGLFVSLASP